MSAIVGLVAARPETIFEDYRRVLALGQVAPPESGDPLQMVTLDAGGDPGFSSPPWQLDGVARAWGLAPGGFQLLDLPGLCPAGRGRKTPPAPGGRMILLAVPGLETGWGVRGAVAMWAAAGGEPVADPRPGPGHLARVPRGMTGGRPAVVCDGILWGVGGGSTGKGYLERNVLLAGNDPVAVDSIALQLAGMDPARFPWLQMMQDAGLGTCEAARIEVRGHTDLLDRPFSGAQWCGPGACRNLGGISWPDLLWRLWSRKRILRRYRESAWGRLALTCQ